ncbi:hypothetical protein Zmor_013748 [Zophobas morio]|uniref:Uncharacterized protein n=1 Tax=Zophobas morio TaxID=2755281 RepID=A0AA38IE05_9CUCU|nr:hypothetical protein Zmor_013748 [Zophobas morio]
MGVKLVILCSIFFVAEILAAPQPLDWNQLGVNALNLGKKALPAGCRLLGGQQPPPPQIYYVNPYPYYQNYPPNRQAPVYYQPPAQYPQNNLPPTQARQPNFENNQVQQD